MSAFAEISRKQRAPGRTLILEPWVFAEDWDERPQGNVCVGIRILADADKSKARAAAESIADGLHENPSGKHRAENWLDAFNSAIICQVAALGICDPNDVTCGASILPMAEEQVAVALSSAGARFIFDQINKYEIESSAIEPELEEEGVDEFCLLLTTNFDRLSASHRKLLAHVLEVLRD